MLRRRKRMTQVMLSKKIGVSQIHVIRIEGGGRVPSAELLDRILAVFGPGAADELLTDEGRELYEPREVQDDD